MGQTYSFYTDDETAAMLNDMSSEDRRSVSNFLTVLIRNERAAREQRALLQAASLAGQKRLFEETTPGTAPSPLAPLPGGEGEVQNG